MLCPVTKLRPHATLSGTHARLLDQVDVVACERTFTDELRGESAP